MTTPPVCALTCPACGGPLASHSAQRCRFCGVALVVPVGAHERFPVSEPTAIHHEIARLREQLRLDPTRPEPHRRLGHAYRSLGLTDDAVRALTVAVGLAPEGIAPRLELATVLASQSAAGVPDAFPVAMRHVRQVLALEPASTGGRLLLARLQTQRGWYGEARATLGGITALPPEEIRRRTAWVTLAEAADHERRGDRRGAVAAWRRIAAEAPELVRPAVASFLSRTPVMGTPARPRRSMPLHAPGVVLVVAAAVGGLTLGLPWPVLLATVGLTAIVVGGRLFPKRIAIETPGWRSSPLPQPLPGSFRAAALPHGAGNSSLPMNQARLMTSAVAPTRQRTTGRSESERLDAELARLLREAELVAAWADLAGRQRQLDWADHLAVALPDSQ